jgi:hypothetical protein
MTTSARAGGLVREVLRTNTGAVRGGGIVREVIRVSAGQAHVSGVVREVLIQDVASARVSGLVREALITTGTATTVHKVLVSGIVREALVFVVGPALPRKRRWLFEEPEDEEEIWLRPRHAVPAIIPPRQKPWLHHLLPDNEDDQEWAFFTRRYTRAPVLAAPRRRPWIDEPEDDEPQLARRFTPATVLATPPRPRQPDDEDDQEWAFFTRRYAAVATTPVVTVLAAPVRPRQPDDDEPEEWLPSRRYAPAAIASLQLKPWRFVDDDELEEGRLPRLYAVPSAAPPPSFVGSLLQRPWLFQDDDEDGQSAELFMRRFSPAPPFVPPAAVGIHDTLFVANVGRMMSRRG